MSISTVDSGPLHVKPEVDLNLNTEANRVLFVLNEIIQRAKLVGLLTELTDNDGYQLRNYFEPMTLQTILQEFDRYSFPNAFVSKTVSDYEDVSRQPYSECSTTNTEYFNKNSASTTVSGAVSGTVSGTVSGMVSGVTSSTISGTVSDVVTNSHRVKISYDGELSKALYLLEENPQVQELVKNMDDKVSPTIKFFIKCLTEFRERMAVRLTENAKQFKTREKYMRETYEKNERAKKEIAKLEEELVVTKTDANVCLIGRNILINRHQNKIEKIKQASQEVIEKRVMESEKAMVNDWKHSVHEQERLKDSYQQASEKYSNMLKDHLATEKILRVKRAKVENQVLGWIQKFDQDIGEKQAEEEEIQALLDKENAELSEIQKKLDEQEEEYDELMQEKAEYEEEILERRLYQFIMFRSARRIQRSYRMYKARKLAKKLAKKGKKEKKGKKGKK